MYKRIVLAYDGSEPGQKALLEGFDIAQWGKSELFLIAVMPELVTAAFGVEAGFYHGDAEDQYRQQYAAVLQEGIRQISRLGIAAEGKLLVGESVSEITKFARQIEADLIVVGHKHLEGWAARWWRSSTSPALIEHAHCSVLVVITQ